MSGWLAFPGGEKRGITEEALDFAAKEERDLRATFEKAKQNKLKVQANPPAYFDDFQFKLCLQQADEDIAALSTLLLNAGRKLEWEMKKKWK